MSWTNELENIPCSNTARNSGPAFSCSSGQSEGARTIFSAKSILKTCSLCYVAPHYLFQVTDANHVCWSECSGVG